MAKDFENEEEPELFKVVKYTFMGIFAYFVVLRMEVLVSLTMYVSASQYRNNSYSVGSLESGVRFACLISPSPTSASIILIRQNNTFSDLFRQIKKTTKGKLVNLLEYKWQSASVGLEYKQNFLFLKIIKVLFILGLTVLE